MIWVPGLRIGEDPIPFRRSILPVEHGLSKDIIKREFIFAVVRLHSRDTSVNDTRVTVRLRF